MGLRPSPKGHYILAGDERDHDDSSAVGRRHLGEGFSHMIKKGLFVHIYIQSAIFVRSPLP